MENPILKVVTVGSQNLAHLLRRIGADDVIITVDEPYEYYSPEEAKANGREWAITAHINVELKREVFDHFVAAFGAGKYITHDRPKYAGDWKEGQRSWTRNAPLDQLSIDPWVAEPGKRRYAVKFTANPKVLKAKYEPRIAQARADICARIEDSKPNSLSAALDDFNEVLARLIERSKQEFLNYLQAIVVDINVGPAWLRSKLDDDGSLLAMEADNEIYLSLSAQIADLKAQRDDIDNTMYRRQRLMVERYVTGIDPLLTEHLEHLSQFKTPTRTNLFGSDGRSRRSADLWKDNAKADINEGE